MFRGSVIVALALLSGKVLAKSCTDLLIPVHFSARNGVFGGQRRLNDNFDATELAVNVTTVGRNYTDDVLTGYATVEGPYNISAQFCTPTSSVQKKQTIQFLVSGGSYDKRYWDWPFDPSNYSYVDFATDDKGYSTFAIDRLCTGNSSHPDPYDVCQTAAYVSTMNNLTTMLRQGAIKEIVDSEQHSIVHVGHSYGSVVVYNYAVQFPENTDGLILTGYGANATWLGQTFAAFDMQVARLNDPARFSDFDPGYLAYDSAFSAMFFQLYRPFTNDNNTLFINDIKDPIAVGELLTTGIASGPAEGFTGPALILNGAEDEAFCGSDCFATGDPNVPSIPAGAQALLPHASPFKVVIQPNMGHTINMHFNAIEAWNTMSEFLDTNVMPGGERKRGGHNSI